AGGAGGSTRRDWGASTGYRSRSISLRDLRGRGTSVSRIGIKKPARRSLSAWRRSISRPPSAVGAVRRIAAAGSTGRNLSLHQPSEVRDENLIAYRHSSGGGVYRGPLACYGESVRPLRHAVDR